MTAALELAGVAIAALLSENLVLVTCMGIGTRPQSFQEPVDALRTGYCLTVVMVLSALISWTADRLILLHFGWAHLRLLVFALLIPALVAGLRSFIQTCLPALAKRMDGNLSAISTNCAALGSALLIAQRSYSLGAALLFALFGGLGSAVALASFASLQQEVALSRIPRCFQGLPIQLITAGLMALSLVGFYGLHLD